ncbi:MAG: phospholipase D-like domain-containing protein [Candidatus Falkowbacteria bacterium]
MLTEQMEERRALRRHYWRARFVLLIIFLMLLSALFGLYNHYKPIPQGLNFASVNHIVNLDDMSFLADTTYQSGNDRLKEQKIFNTAMAQIAQAQQYILVDMFLFNDAGRRLQPDRLMGRELTELLLAKKQANPDIKIDLLLDPINTFYSSVHPDDIERLKTAKINVIEVDLEKLRDNNPFYSGPWRLLFSWLGTKGFGWIVQPFDGKGEKSTVRAYLEMLNFKADHRKIFLCDDGQRLVTIIGSMNVHGLSADNSNAAWLIKGSFGTDVYRAEQAVAQLSGQSLSILPDNLQTDQTPGKNHYGQVRLLTEGRIREEIIKTIQMAQPGDTLDFALFYLSERALIKEILAASGRGVNIRLILDPNKDAFGYQKSGIPNRAVADELVTQSGRKIVVRWYDTRGEQFHSKFLLWHSLSNNSITMIAGSANFTKRNLDNFNLEADVAIKLPDREPQASQLQQYYDRLWNNQDGVYTDDYSVYSEQNWLKYWWYRFGEGSGLSSY